ncbi:LysR family transcriptional regulator [Terasakiella sp. A23]|uniref:LysR family transcriptional regulator n=1 Tax=Terasakiella sp. FCG-A23 TaxID=3080561 RepID=UPI002955C6F0|nr:LysR family transcriptional regulator [Terasakiella sp. A23]MDV7341202.1 LysR family transcriptional regulator [Terasakiella sp. A23]
MKKNLLGQVNDLEIKQLKIFKAVTDCGGFSAAETELLISRPTISNHIADLEARLNMKLCKRGRSGFSLTEEGSIVYEQTRQLLEEIDKFRRSVNDLCGSPSGVLKISISDSIATDTRSRLPEIIKQYSEVAPDVEIQFDVEHMAEMERKVLNNKTNIAIIPYHRQLYGLNYIHLFTDMNYLYCGQEHPLYACKEEDLSTEIINQYKLVHAGLNPHEEVYKHLAEMNTSAISYFYESRIPLLLSGQYIGFLPEEYAKPYVEQGLLKAIGTDLKHFQLGVAVITRKTAQPSRARSIFIDIVRSIHNVENDEPPY